MKRAFFTIAPPWTIRIGSSRVTVVDEQKKILFNEPAFVAFETKTGRPVAFGEEAKEFAKVSSTEIEVARLTHFGLITDEEICVHYLLWMRERLHQGGPLRKLLWNVFPYPVRAVISVNTVVPYRSILARCLLRAHFLAINYVSDPLGDLSATNLSSVASPIVVIRIGATHTQIAVVVSKIIVLSSTLYRGGDDLDLFLQRALEQTRGFHLPFSKCQELKESYVRAILSRNLFSMVLRGKEKNADTMSSLTLQASDIEPFFEDYFADLAARSKAALCIDLHFEGVRETKVIVSGGVSIFPQAQKALSHALGFPVTAVSRPALASVLGGVNG